MIRKRFEWKLRTRTLQLGDRTLIMGVLNVTPDSFSDGGKFGDPDRALARAIQMEEEGVDIIDIGAESTKPGSQRISEAEELRRLIPVLKRLRGEITVPLSVDTYKSAVAIKALEYGVEIINDPSGLTFDVQIARAASNGDAGLIINHMRGTPDMWAKLSTLKDSAGTVIGELDAAVNRARSNGVDPKRIVIDPGLGFGKRREQNSELIARLGEFVKLNYPILIGPSRKQFLAQLDPEKLEFATAAAVTASIMNGAHMVRVHDINAILPAVQVADAIVTSQPAPVEAEEPKETSRERRARVASHPMPNDEDRRTPLRPPHVRPLRPVSPVRLRSELRPPVAPPPVSVPEPADELEEIGDIESMPVIDQPAAAELAVSLESSSESGLESDAEPSDGSTSPNMAESAKPAELVEAAGPVNAAEPAEAAESAKAAEFAEADEASKADEPAKSAPPAKALRPPVTARPPSGSPPPSTSRPPSAPPSSGTRPPSRSGHPNDSRPPSRSGSYDKRNRPPGRSGPPGGDDSRPPTRSGSYYDKGNRPPGRSGPPGEGESRPPSRSGSYYDKGNRPPGRSGPPGGSDSRPPSKSGSYSKGPRPPGRSGPPSGGDSRPYNKTSRPPGRSGPPGGGDSRPPSKSGSYTKGPRPPSRSGPPGSGGSRPPGGRPTKGPRPAGPPRPRDKRK